MKPIPLWAAAALVLLVLAGCSHRAPTIAHVHIGHAMTGWHDTPDKAGLFIVAETKAAEALKSAQTAVNGSRDLNRIKTDIARVSRLSEASTLPEGTDTKYGVKEALTGAVSHITYAATSPDATPNIHAFADGFKANAAGVLDRCDLIAALSVDIGASEAIDEVELLAPEIEKLARANIYGEDLDGDGRIGNSANEYGLAQLRRDIEDMIAREDPPYSTVNAWYLFNLIRLPDGSWKFRSRQSANADDPYGGGGGGGGGGGY